MNTRAEIEKIVHAIQAYEPADLATHEITHNSNAYDIVLLDDDTVISLVESKKGWIVSTSTHVKCTNYTTAPFALQAICEAIAQSRCVAYDPPMTSGVLYYRSTLDDRVALVRDNLPFACQIDTIYPLATMRKDVAHVIVTRLHKAGPVTVDRCGRGDSYWIRQLDISSPPQDRYFYIDAHGDVSSSMHAATYRYPFDKWWWG